MLLTGFWNSTFSYTIAGILFELRNRSKGSVTVCNGGCGEAATWWVSQDRALRCPDVVCQTHHIHPDSEA